MNISSALKLIQKELRQDAIVSKHFRDQCSDRNFDVLQIFDIIRNNRILGILEQGEGLYKVWYSHTKEKDLNIVLTIGSTDRIKLITVFPSHIERRKR